MTSLNPTPANNQPLEAPRFRHMTNGYRTAEQDLQCHVDGHRTYQNFGRLIERAEEILKDCPPGHFDGERVCKARRALFEAQIVNAREQLKSMLNWEDAFHVWQDGGTYLATLSAAIGEYVGEDLTTDWLNADLSRYWWAAWMS